VVGFGVQFHVRGRKVVCVYTAQTFRASNFDYRGSPRTNEDRTMPYKRTSSERIEQRQCVG